jgi:8-oxo-dGTP pyrophosphatase MutT (NUDIX family)
MPETSLTCINVVEHPDIRDFYLLVEETAVNKQELLNLPGGGRDPGEYSYQTAGREAKEESGFEVEATHFISYYEYPPDKLHIALASKIIGGALATCEEHPRVGFFSFEDIVDLDAAGCLRGPAVLDAIRKYHEGKAIPLGEVSLVVEHDKTRDAGQP